MNELLDKYRARFGEQFPLMLCRGMSEDKICDILQKCLDEGKPYNPNLDPDANY